MGMVYIQVNSYVPSSALYSEEGLVFDHLPVEAC